MNGFPDKGKGASLFVFKWPVFETQFKFLHLQCSKFFKAPEKQNQMNKDKDWKEYDVQYKVDQGSCEIKRVIHNQHLKGEGLSRTRMELFVGLGRQEK